MNISPLQKHSFGKRGTKSSDAVIAENSPGAPALELSSDAVAHFADCPSACKPEVGRDKGRMRPTWASGEPGLYNKI